MKKNLISVIILALVLTNLVLTALLIFSVLPQTKKANQLIEKVCKAIDLDLNSGAASGTTNNPSPAPSVNSKVPLFPFTILSLAFAPFLP